MQCVFAFDDTPRFFTNGHGGYQFFHADEHLIHSDRRIDAEGSYSDVNHVIQPLPQPQSEVKVTSAPSVRQNHKPVPKIKFAKRVLVKSEQSDEDLSSENRILQDVTTQKPLRTTSIMNPMRKRIVVRKFKPRAKTPKPPTEKNKKREISSAATGNGLHGARSKIPHKYKFTNRNFKPRQVEKPKNNAPPKQYNRGALFTRKPSETLMQLHFRKLDITTTTTSASPIQSMKEKRHLANIRFFNRRKLRT